MYIVRHGSAMKGFATSGEVYLRFVPEGSFTALEFKSKLDAGETVELGNLRVYLQGTPVTEDLKANLMRYIIDSARDYCAPDFELGMIFSLRKCLSVSDVDNTLDSFGIPEDEEMKILAILFALDVGTAHRFPSDFQDELTFEEITNILVRRNTRQHSFPPLPLDGSKLWVLCSIVDYDGQPRMDIKRLSWIGSVIEVLLLKRGYPLMIDFIMTPDGYLSKGSVWTTPVVEINTLEGVLHISSMNGSVYKFEELREPLVFFSESFKKG